MTTSAGARLAPLAMSLCAFGAVGLVGASAAMATGETDTTTTAATATTAAPPESTLLGAGVCAEEHLEWAGSVLLASFSPEFDTGLVVPVAEPGGTVEILGATWVARNVYPEQLPEHTRGRDNQEHESFALFVGGTQVGSLTPDLPDTVDEGAVSEWASGDQLGSFGAATVTGGPVVLKHSYLFGFEESANSLEPQLISIDLRRCGPPVPTTTCTCPPTTEAPTTTVEVIAPSTEPIATTESIVETTSTTVIPTTTRPAVSTTQPILVATGRTSGWIVGAGGASLLSGLTLLRLRRRGLAR